MEDIDIRWFQRFSNFKKALFKLAEIVENRTLEELSELEKEGLIQRFEYTFELAWKTLQDLLIERGYIDVIGPNPVIAQSFQNGYINDAEGWKLILKSRNLTSHTYNSEIADKIAQQILERFYFLFSDLDAKLDGEMGKNKALQDLE